VAGERAEEGDDTAAGPFVGTRAHRLVDALPSSGSSVGLNSCVPS
jgi:hypothetical protein